MTLESALKLCESPLEKALVSALHAKSYDYPPNKLKAARHLGSPNFVGLEIGAFSCLWVQVPIHRYRADLLIAPDDFDEGGPDAWRLVVEVDGHDFHERTKEQATRDRSRDRWMLANSIHVMRFTGHEVWASAGTCADEVLAMLPKLAAPRLDRQWAEMQAEAA